MANSIVRLNHLTSSLPILLQIVIKDSGHPIPVEMYNGFEAHGVKIVLEVKQLITKYMLSFTIVIFSCMIVKIYKREPL